MRVPSTSCLLLVALFLVGTTSVRAGEDDAALWRAAAHGRSSTASGNQSVAAGLLERAEELRAGAYANADEKRQNFSNAGDLELSAGDLERGAAANYRKAAGNWRRAANSDGLGEELKVQYREHADTAVEEAGSALRSAESDYVAAADAFSSENADDSAKFDVASARLKDVREELVAMEEE